MTNHLIPEDIREFILLRLDSVAELEALLLLWRNPHQEWDVNSLAKRLYITESDVHRVLRQLAAQDLVAENKGVYRFWRSSEELGTLVDRLAQLYSTHLVSIANLMHSKSSRSVQEFANAFVLRKDK